MATQEVRPMRMCDVCGGVDTDPRHVFGYADGDGTTDSSVGAKALDNASGEEAKAAVLAHIQDNSTTMRHMDCCADAGCPDGTCDQIVADAGGKTGDELVAHLTKGS